MKARELETFIADGGNSYLPHLSIDCVVFGFHQNQLKVLLLKMKHSDRWSLPGGFIKREESLEAAASRILKERTGLDHIFLQQLHVFSNPKRSHTGEKISSLKKAGIKISKDHWF